MPPPADPDVPSPRESRRARKRERSRAEILDAARAVMVRGGVAATTLEAVAREIGVSKAALYYYFPSKEALLFELVFGAIDAHARAVAAGVAAAADGAGALAAILRETVRAFAPHLDDFRLAFLHGQVAGPGAVRWNAEQFARIRPLNDLVFGAAAQKIAAGRAGAAPADQPTVPPRLLAFLAQLAAIGILTMKGMVEHHDDPLLYSDDQLVEGFATIFAAASRAPETPA